MEISKVRVTLRGISPLLMNAYPMTPITALDKRSVEEQAEHAAYRDAGTRQLYIPATCIQRAIVNGAAFCKGKGRSSLQKVVAACITVQPDMCMLGATEYKVDLRPVVIPSTKGRVVRARPRIDEWVVTFDVEFDPTLVKESDLRTAIDYMGQRVGLLDFRPAKNGPFGRSVVAGWERV